MGAMEKKELVSDEGTYDSSSLYGETVSLASPKEVKKQILSEVHDNIHDTLKRPCLANSRSAFKEVNDITRKAASN